MKQQDMWKQTTYGLDPDR